MKESWIDVWFGGFKFYRKYKGGVWYRHENTFQLSGLIFNYFWAKYGEINRFTRVVKIEKYGNKEEGS